MRVLVSTFGGDDADKVILAMRNLAYEKLVLLGKRGIEDSDGFKKIQELEEVSGHVVGVELLEDDGLLEQVEGVCEALANLSKGTLVGTRNSVSLNISGGSKLLGDAALLAAFRLGVEAYHCDKRVIRLPTLRGVTVADRFTPSQVRLLSSLAPTWMSMDNVLVTMRQASKQSVERAMRELRKAGLVEANVKNGKMLMRLTEKGKEAAAMIRMTGAKGSD